MSRTSCKTFAEFFRFAIEHRFATGHDLIPADNEAYIHVISGVPEPTFGISCVVCGTSLTIPVFRASGESGERRRDHLRYMGIGEGGRVQGLQNLMSDADKMPGSFASKRQDAIVADRMTLPTAWEREILADD